MFRLFAVALVLGAFGGALYFGGNAMEAWESPKPENVPIPKSKKAKTKVKHAERVRLAKPAKKPEPAKASWLVELNATCRRGKRESESIHQPAIPQEIAPMLKQAIGLNARMNRKTAALVSRSGNATAAAQLRTLYAQDEALLQRALNAANKGQYHRLQGIARELIAVGRAENNLFARLGADACTVSPDELRL
jgi:hypothetical protein